ncbi:tetratricopeptide repeat protein [Amycolatopsis sp. NPDC051758]|uniref:tetratricopeptide repeat protein n=1 Tax=Amycolatopsis sp. NPDC051758 TaxID=3363935 RepID=UPI0037993A9F
MTSWRSSSGLAFRPRAGDPAGAVAALKELLTDRRRVLGADHPETLATRHHLVQWRKRLSKSVSS